MCALKVYANEIESVCSNFHLYEVGLHPRSIEPVQKLSTNIRLFMQICLSCQGIVLIP